MAVQTRLVETSTKLTVWVQISDEDRRRCINRLPGRWAEMVKRRENGESVEALWRTQRRLDENEFRKALMLAFQKVELWIAAIAEARAGVRR